MKKPSVSRLPAVSDLIALARAFEFRTVSRWVGLGIIVGLVSGIGAALFFLGMDWVHHVVLYGWGNLNQLEPHGEASLFAHSRNLGAPRYWVVVLAPALGGLLSGILVFKLAPEAEGHGTDSLIDSFHRHGGHVRTRVPLVKGIASVILIGTGGSAGREGPIAQIGAGFSSYLGKLFKLSAREKRLLLLAGAAGGIGAIFRTPLGAALFVVEVLYRDDFELEALVPAVFSSVVAYSVFTMLFGEGTIFVTEKSYAFNPLQLPLYLTMALGASLIGVLYIKVFYGVRDRIFAPLRVPRPFKPLIGGLAVGLLALVFPNALGAGYGALQAALLPGTGVFPLGWTGAGALLGIAVIKVITTSLSVSSGGSGGVFGPSVVIGGMVGGAFGMAFHALMPEVVPQPGAFVIVGMACFVGGVAHAPISSLVMASEMTGSYDLLVPIMLAEGVTSVCMRRFTLYEKQVATRRDSQAHCSEYVLNLLEEIRVEDVFAKEGSVEEVDVSMPLPRLLRLASESRQSVFPVRGKQGELSGLIAQDTLRAFFYDEELGRFAIAADCMVPFVSLQPADSLAEALKRFSRSHCPQLPVVEGGEATELLGLLSYEELLDAYNRELERRRTP